MSVEEPSLNEHLDEFEECDFDSVKLSLVQYVEKLIDEFDRYVPDIDLSWCRGSETHLMRMSQNYLKMFKDFKKN